MRPAPTLGLVAFCWTIPRRRPRVLRVPTVTATNLGALIHPAQELIMSTPRNRQERLVLEARIRKACLAVACPTHGTHAKGISLTWGPDPLGRTQGTVKVIPQPCCDEHDKAIYQAFAKATGGTPPS